MLAAGLGELVVGVGAMLGAAKLGDGGPPPDGCPVEQPVMAKKATTTAAATLRFMSTSFAIGGMEASPEPELLRG